MRSLLYPPMKLGSVAYELFSSSSSFFRRFGTHGREMQGAMGLGWRKRSSTGLSKGFVEVGPGGFSGSSKSVQGNVTPFLKNERTTGEMASLPTEDGNDMHVERRR